jgi:hypothetical protein
MTMTRGRLAIVALIAAALAGALLIVARSPSAGDQDTPAAFGH